MGGFGKGMVGDKTDLEKDLGAVWRKLGFDKLNELGERMVSERRLFEKKGLLLRMKGSREEMGSKKGKERIRIGRVSCSVGLVVSTVRVRSNSKKF